MEPVVRPEIENVVEKDPSVDKEADKAKHAAFRTRSIN